MAGFTDANGSMNGAKEVFLRLLAPGGAAIWTRTSNWGTAAHEDVQSPP